VAIFSATDANLQIVYALLVCVLCLTFQAEFQPFVDDGEDFLGVVSQTCLSMTLIVGLGLKIPNMDPLTSAMMNALAVAVSVFAFLVGLYEMSVDTRDALLEDAELAGMLCPCCGGSKDEEVVDDVEVGSDGSSAPQPRKDADVSLVGIAS
jgi:hypothetical protein